MPSLKATVDRLEDVPEDARQYYIEKIVKDARGTERSVYALNIHGLPRHPEAVALSNALARTKSERDVLRRQAASLVAGDGIKAHLLKAGCSESYLRAAIALCERQITVSENKDGFLEATGPGGLPLSKFAESFMQGEGQVFHVDQVTNRGIEAGADDQQRSANDRRPTGGGSFENNPWSRRTWNNTAQGQIYKADKERANRMARAAGHQDALTARITEAR